MAKEKKTDEERRKIEQEFKQFVERTKHELEQAGITEERQVHDAIAPRVREHERILKRSKERGSHRVFR